MPTDATRAVTVGHAPRRALAALRTGASCGAPIATTMFLERVVDGDERDVDADGVAREVDCSLPAAR